MAATANGSAGNSTVDSSRNFIINDNVNTLEGARRDDGPRERHFKSKHKFNVNANKDHSECGANLNCRIDHDHPAKIS